MNYSPLACLLVFVLMQLGSQPTDKDIHHRTEPAGAPELAAITERGREIAAYDSAAWHATDAVQALKPADDLVGMYVGRKTPEGWEVGFGKLNEARDAFLLAFEVYPTGDLLKPRVVVNTPAKEERSDWLFEARAYDLAREQLRVTVPYNGTVLNGPDGGWYVYFYPAPTVADVWPVGADVRFLVSHDGTKIVETHRMHASLLSNDFSDKSKTVKMTFHTAFLDDAPEDMDVANVLMEGGMPMLVMGRTFTYQIEADGKAKYIGRSEDIRKNAGK